MRKLKFILPLASIVLVLSISLTSCEKREDWRFPELGNGGFIKFLTQPVSYDGTAIVSGQTTPDYSIGSDIAAASFNGFVEDPNGNISTVRFTVLGDFENAPQDPVEFANIAAGDFPYDVSFTAADMAALFQVDVSVFQEDDGFEFFTTITTNSGVVYSWEETECEDCPTEVGDPDGPGAWNGGNIDNVLSSGGTSGGLLTATHYRVRFRDL
jgi:hypothetical protein